MVKRTWIRIRITNLSDGIKFLGCSVRIYGVKNLTLLIKPHPAKVQTFKNRIREICLKYKGQAPEGIKPNHSWLG